MARLKGKPKKMTTISPQSTRQKGGASGGSKPSESSGGLSGRWVETGGFGGSFFLKANGGKDDN